MGYCASLYIRSESTTPNEMIPGCNFRGLRIGLYEDSAFSRWLRSSYDAMAMRSGSCVKLYDSSLDRHNRSKSRNRASPTIQRHCSWWSGSSGRWYVFQCLPFSIYGKIECARIPEQLADLMQPGSQRVRTPAHAETRISIPATKPAASVMDAASPQAGWAKFVQLRAKGDELVHALPFTARRTRAIDKPKAGSLDPVINGPRALSRRHQNAGLNALCVRSPSSLCQTCSGLSSTIATISRIFANTSGSFSSYTSPCRSLSTSSR